MFSDPISFAQAFLALEERIRQCPRGTISKKARRRKDGSTRLDYYFQFYVDGVRREKYIRQADVPAMLRQFEQKKQWKRQRREMEDYLLSLDAHDRKRFRAAISLGRAWDVVHAHRDALEAEKFEDSMREAAASGTGSILPPAEITSSGLRVRSRVEEMCVGITMEYGLRLRYEIPIVTAEQIAYQLPPYTADFEITDPESGRRWFWEHLGRLDDSAYLAHQRYKLQAYRQEGLIRGQNLIITISRRHVNKQLILWELMRAGAIDPREVRRHYRQNRKLVDKTGKS